MRRILTWSVLVLTACAGPEPTEAPGRSREAMFSTTPVHVGALGERWGRNLAPCGAGIVAGAAIDGRAIYGPPLEVENVGVPISIDAVLCEENATHPRLTVSGDGGLWWTQTGTWVQLLEAKAQALARHPANANMPTLVGVPAANEVFAIQPLNVNRQFTLSLDAGNNTGFGAAIAWHPTLLRFAVGAPQAGLVRVYDVNAATGTTVAVKSLAVANALEFGRALAWGNVSPSNGPELLVGARGAVYVFSATLELVSTLAMPDAGPSFGASLALQASSPYGDLGYAWVGAPEVGRVFRFIGTTGSPMSPDALLGSGLGASMAAYGPSDLAFGAPDYQGSAGAIFKFNEPPLGPLPGTTLTCTAGSACYRPGCELGTCVGGVFCQGDALGGAACSVGQVCTVDGLCRFPDGGVPPGALDAGAADAGAARDAGLKLDAGNDEDAGPPRDAGPQPDAGTDEDAGTPRDAGPQPDAGTDEDAGTPRDAGLAEDAGTRHDAGATFDAGTADGGDDAGAPSDGGVTGDAPVVFRTCSCSSGALMPLALLGLALLRRRPR